MKKSPRIKDPQGKTRLWEKIVLLVVVVVADKCLLDTPGYRVEVVFFSANHSRVKVVKHTNLALVVLSVAAVVSVINGEFL